MNALTAHQHIETSWTAIFLKTLKIIEHSEDNEATFWLHTSRVTLYFPIFFLHPARSSTKVILQNKIYQSSLHAVFFCLFSLAYGEQKTSCLSLSWPLAIHHIQSLYQEVKIIVFCVEKSSYQETKGSKTRESKLAWLSQERKKQLKSIHLRLYTFAHNFHWLEKFLQQNQASSIVSFFLSYTGSEFKFPFHHSTKSSVTSYYTLDSQPLHLVFLYPRRSRNIKMGAHPLTAALWCVKWCACYSDE